MAAMSRRRKSESWRSILSRVKALVAGECANHQGEASGIRDFCWMRAKSNKGVCVFFSDIEAPRCRYFQESVLPGDKELRGIFSPETLALQIREDRKRMTPKKCERCPETFLARSGRQRFCPVCQKWNESEKTRARMANLRKKPIGMSPVTV
jgi:hypothetical protein